MAVVAGLGAGLVAAAPLGPGQPVTDRVDGVGDQLGEQPPDLVECQRDQRMLGVLPAFPRGDHGEDGVGEHDQRDVPIPGGPLADLRLVQADGLSCLETGFDVPADSGDPDQGAQRYRSG